MHRTMRPDRNCWSAAKNRKKPVELFCESKSPAEGGGEILSKIVLDELSNPTACIHINWRPRQQYEQLLLFNDPAHSERACEHNVLLTSRDILGNGEIMRIQTQPADTLRIAGR